MSDLSSISNNYSFSEIAILKTNPISLSSAVLLLLFGHLLLGIAHIAILPPWEGFDENAHYSCVQQIADKWELPRLGKARISKDVEQYVHFGPICYRSTPPFEKNRGFTYKSFFEAPIDTVTRGWEYIHRRPVEMRRYTEGNRKNWQAQHPPLYYLLLSPVYIATRHLSWGAHLFILRLVSYLFAWSALLVAFYTYFISKSASSSQQETYKHHWGMLGVAVWPVLFPQWFPEMARLGNDSLCALIMAVIWLITIRAMHTGQWTRYSITLGILLGLGCLTKAFFEPITYGILGFLIFHRLKSEGRRAIKSVLIHLLLICALIACIAGWWYIEAWYGQVALRGTFALKEAGGILYGLTRNFTVFAFVRGHAALITTIAWCGTWSFARPPYVYFAPMAFIVVFTAISYLTTLRRSSPTGIEWLPVWLATPVLMGLSYYVFACIAFRGEGRGVGGYYLHFLAVPLGVAVGHGLGKWWHRKGFRVITLALSLYAVVFSVVLSWLQILLFSGLVFRLGANKFYKFPDTLPSFLGLPVAISRLRTIAFPELGVIMWLSGGIMVMIGLILTWKVAHPYVSKTLS